MENLSNYLVISSILFSLGLFGVVTRRNGVAVLMGVELILNAANLNFLAFARFGGMNMSGHVYALFVIVLAAAEAAVAVQRREQPLRPVAGGVPRSPQRALQARALDA